MDERNDRPPITPDISVEALLEAYPDVEQRLIELAPALQKLRTPALRRTVARVTSVRQVAAAAGASLGELVSELRVAAGLEQPFEEGGGEQRPGWLAACDAVETLDAREEIESGGHPLPGVMAALDRLPQGQAFAIVTPFVPAPMIEMVQQKGFVSWTEHKGPAHFITYFARA
jgi:hypothetical protein